MGPMTTAMSVAFGYDDHGNSPALLAEADRLVIDAGKFVRVAGEAPCQCGSLYRHHPTVQGAIWLHRACDGLVKL